MTGFNYTCPKCSRTGSNSDLGCFNCDHRVVIENKNGQSVLTCSNCGLDQLPTCPSCHSVITWKKIEEHSSIAGAIILVLVVVFFMKTCDDKKPNNQIIETDPVPAVVDNPPVTDQPEINNEPDPAPNRWTVPADDQPTPSQRTTEEPVPSPHDQQPAEPQWTIPKEE